MSTFVLISQTLYKEILFTWVTDRVSNFPQLALDQFEIEAIEADEFLARTFELYTVEARNVLRQLRSRYQNPKMAPSELFSISQQMVCLNLRQK